MKWNFQRVLPQTKLSDIATAERDTVSMEQVIGAYLGIAPRNGRIPCPLHNGKDKNFAIYPHSFKCFVCNESGDIIQFVEKFFCISWEDAVRKINDDFRLGLPIGRDASIEEAYRISTRREELRRQEEERQAHEEHYWELWGEWIRLDKLRMNSSPYSDEYADAVKNIDYVGYRIDTEL